MSYCKSSPSIRVSGTIRWWGEMINEQAQDNSPSLSLEKQPVCVVVLAHQGNCAQVGLKSVDSLCCPRACWTSLTCSPLYLISHCKGNIQEERLLKQQYAPWVTDRNDFTLRREKMGYKWNRHRCGLKQHMLKTLCRT